MGTRQTCLYNNCGWCLDCLRVERSGGPVEEVVELSLSAAAQQALWDLKQWVEDHEKGCDCFTCKESIPDLEKALTPAPSSPGVCC